MRRGSKANKMRMCYAWFPSPERSCGSRQRVTRAVQPVWWQAPRPLPLSPYLKVFH